MARRALLVPWLLYRVPCSGYFAWLGHPPLPFSAPAGGAGFELSELAVETLLALAALFDPELWGVTVSLLQEAQTKAQSIKATISE